MSEVRIAAESRESAGKSSARALRRDGKVPAVLYGHGEDVRSLSLDARALRLALRSSGTLLSVSLEGEDHLALPKEVQRHPVRDEIQHVDLLIVRRGEKVTVDVPITLVGEAVAGGVLTQVLTTLSIEVEATSIPSELEVDIDGLDIGGQRLVSDVRVPEGATVLTAEDDVVASVLAPAVEVEEEEAEAGEALAEGEEPAEGEEEEAE